VPTSKGRGEERHKERAREEEKGGEGTYFKGTWEKRGRRKGGGREKRGGDG